MPASRRFNAGELVNVTAAMSSTGTASVFGLRVDGGNIYLNLTSAVPEPRHVLLIVVVLPGAGSLVLRGRRWPAAT